MAYSVEKYVMDFIDYGSDHHHSEDTAFCSAPETTSFTQVDDMKKEINELQKAVFMNEKRIKVLSQRVKEEQFIIDKDNDIATRYKKDKALQDKRKAELFKKHGVKAEQHCVGKEFVLAVEEAKKKINTNFISRSFVLNTVEHRITAESRNNHT